MSGGEPDKPPLSGRGDDKGPGTAQTVRKGRGVQNVVYQIPGLVLGPPGCEA